MNILADEGFNGILVSELRESGYEIAWIAEISPGILDQEVISHAQSNNQILLTEDKDFGEWVFAHQIKGLTIIFIRYKFVELTDILTNIKLVLQNIESNLTVDATFEFITITHNKIRRRKIV